MPASIIDGPQFVYGNMAQVLSAIFGAAVGDPNLDAGPSADYQGRGIIDPRFFTNKDMIQGYTGKLPIHYSMPQARTVAQIPSTLSATAIAGAQGVTSGVAMTLASANATGITVNVPYIPFTQAGVNQLPSGITAPSIAPVWLDFGFAFGNVASGNTTITVGDSAEFAAGMPIVIAGAGNAAGTVPLLTSVTAVPTSTTIQVLNAPLSSVNPAAIGTGNAWGPSPTWSTLANIVPTAHLPWLAAGSGLFLDPRQAIARGVSITGVSGGAGGAFTVKALDIYNVVCTQTITVAAGSNTVYGTKAVKAVLSVVPNFTDTTHNYSVGTSDMFGAHYRTPIWDDLEVSWANAYMSSSTGFTAPTTLYSGAQTAATGDIRGTVQVSGNGPLGSGIGSTASNGTVSSLLATGNRLMIQQSLQINRAAGATPANFASLFGLTQF